MFCDMKQKSKHQLKTTTCSNAKTSRARRAISDDDNVSLIDDETTSRDVNFQLVSPSFVVTQDQRLDDDDDVGDLPLHQHKQQATVMTSRDVQRVPDVDRHGGSGGSGGGGEHADLLYGERVCEALKCDDACGGDGVEDGDGSGSGAGAGGIA